MAKIRSNKLWQHLNDSGALWGSEEDIDHAKKEYRRIAKKEWKRKNDLIVKELRPRFTISELEKLKSFAQSYGLSPTIYFKKITLASLNNQNIIPDKNMLLKILQNISMAYNQTEKYKLITFIKNLRENLEQAEHLLINYLNSHK